MANKPKPLPYIGPVEAGVGGVRKVVAGLIERAVAKPAAKVAESTYNKVGDAMPKPNINASSGAKITKVTGKVSVQSAKGGTSVTPDAKTIISTKAPLSESQIKNIQNMHNAKIEKTAQTAAQAAASAVKPEIAKAGLKGAAVGATAVYVADKLADNKPKGTQPDHAVTSVDRKTGKAK